MVQIPTSTVCVIQADNTELLSNYGTREKLVSYCWTMYFAIHQWGHRLFILVSASNDLSSSDSSGSSGSDETDLLSSAGSPPDGGGLANVLMVTTTVGMLHGVHSNTTNLKNKKPIRC